MGELKKPESDSMLQNYLLVNGISLSSEGSAELGLNKTNALGFIALLHQKNIPVLGIEVWRYSSGRHRIDSIGGWYSISLVIETNHPEVIEFINSSNLEQNDVVTIQF
jgi:hypothetical protein